MEIQGKDLPELFRNAGFAVFDSITDLDHVACREAQTIELQAESLESLFMDWLRELLFRFATEYFIVKEVRQCKVQERSGDTIPNRSGSGHVPAKGQGAGWTLKAEVRGEKFDPARHEVKIEIKTPTYHMFKIEKHESGCRATVVFDV